MADTPYVGCRNVLFVLAAIFLAIFVANRVELPEEYESMLPKRTLVRDLADKASQVKAFFNKDLKPSSWAESSESIFNEPLPERLTPREMREARLELEEHKKAQKDGLFSSIYEGMAKVMTFALNLEKDAKKEENEINEIRKQIYQMQHAKISTIDDCKVYEAIHVTEYRRVILTLAETLGIPEPRIKSLFMAENLDKHEETFKTFDMSAKNGQVLFGKILVQRIHHDWLSMMYTFTAVRFSPESKENQQNADRLKDIAIFKEDGTLSTSFKGADMFKRYFYYTSQKYFAETCKFSKNLNT